MSHTQITMYGTLWCTDCKRAKQFFGEQRVHYDFVDIDGDAEGMRAVEEANNGKHVIPVIKFGDFFSLRIKQKQVAGYANRYRPFFWNTWLAVG